MGYVDDDGIDTAGVPNIFAVGSTCGHTFKQEETTSLIAAFCAYELAGCAKDILEEAACSSKNPIDKWDLGLLLHTIIKEVWTDNCTCFGCKDADKCGLAFDDYNTNGDCLAYK